MNYKSTLDFLFSQLPMYQRIGQAAYKADLETTIAIDNYLKNPHKNFRTIHIAGTNGKGSVSHKLASVLQNAGYKTGLYTSPHLIDFRERIKINGKEISKDYVVEFVKTHKQLFSELKPSFFEMTVAMAFQYFADQNVDIAVIETGMGGRLDSTNIITPLVSVITNIGLDHTRFLGETIVKIAGEKAGIIKTGISVVIGQHIEDADKVFLSTAKEKNAPISFAEDNFNIDYSMQTLDGKQLFNIESKNTAIVSFPNLKIDLLGIYQKKNLITCLQTINILKQQGVEISIENIYTGLKNVAKNTGLQGRWQITGINPRIVCDTAHNKEGIAEIVSQISQTAYKKLHMIIGFVNDKNVRSVLELLPKGASYYFTKAKIPRSLPVNELFKVASKVGLSGNQYPDVAKAVKTAIENADKDDMIYIGGSTFIVADYLESV